jgi:hypothetical protein
MVPANLLATLPRSMRRFLALIAAAAALGLVAPGCGGGGSNAKSPLDEGLGFLPKDAPFAVAISTDTESGQYKSAGAILKKFPFGPQALAGLRQRFERNGVSFENDVKPILGNPFVVGAPSPGALQSNSRNQYVASLKAKDSGKLDDIVKKDSKQVGDKNGFTVYESKNGQRLARKDDVVVFAGSNKLLDDALATRGGDNRLTEADFDKGLSGLPKDAAIRVYGDAQRLLNADPSSATARKVKWVNALRKFGLTGSVNQDSIDIGFNLQTDAGQLTDADLPLASGDPAPKVVEQAGEVSFGLRDPAQVEKFAEAAGQAVNPSGFGQFEQAKRTIEKQLGISIDKDVLSQLTGDISGVTGVSGKFAARADLKDPGAFRTTLKKVAPALPRLLNSTGGGGSAKLSRSGGGLYRLKDRNGQTVVFGVQGSAFVVGDDPARARKLAAATPTSVPGVSGSVVTSADAEKLANAIIGRLGAKLGPGVSLLGTRFTAPLGNLTGSVKTTTSGMSGKLTLTID